MALVVAGRLCSYGLLGEPNRKGIDTMLDITGAEALEVRIRADGTVLWVNGPEGCVLRICQIKGPIVIEDERPTSGRTGRHAHTGHPWHYHNSVAESKDLSHGMKPMLPVVDPSTGQEYIP